MSTTSAGTEEGKSWQMYRTTSFLPETRLYLRVVNASDVTAMSDVERDAWSLEHAASPAAIQQRLSANPACTIGAFRADSGQLIGFFTLLGTTPEKVKIQKPWECYAQLADKSWESEEILYGISLTIANSAPRGTGTCVMQSAIDYKKWLRAKKIITVTRAPSYHRVQASMSFHDYYNRLIRGEVKEPLYYLMRSAGWKLTGYCPSYYRDVESGDYGLRFEA